MIDEVEQYLSRRRSMVLATRVGNEVRASTTGYALGENMTLYSFVFRDSVKHRGILESPQVAAVVDDGFSVPMRAVEIIGTAEVVAGAERQHGQELLIECFPDLSEALVDPRVLIVRINPDRVRFTDWTYGAGHSREAAVRGPGSAGE
jgi:uncharacterized protein YhbP (UPF0306 family)